MEAGDAGGVGGGDGEDELVGGDDGGGRREQAGLVEGVEVVGVGGDDEVGAGAGFDLEAEDLGAGEVGDDLDVGVGALEGVGGFGEGFAEGGGGEDVEFAGGGGVAGGEEEEREERLEGRGCARKSFFQKTLEARRGLFGPRIGVGVRRADGGAGGGGRPLRQRFQAEAAPDEADCRGQGHPELRLRRQRVDCTLYVNDGQGGDRKR